MRKSPILFQQAKWFESYWSKWHLGLHLGITVIQHKKKAYKHLSGYRQVHPSFRWLWASSYQNKHKVFWLLLHDRLSTREILRRKSMNLPSYNCVLCNQGCEESLEHLFLRCRFAKDWWASIGLSTPQQLNPEQTIEHFKSSLGVPFFVEIIVIMSWEYMEV